ncbi:MAG: DNA-formamidopyrimidine glycosylase family protein [Nanoarchaeota archaeon]
MPELPDVEIFKNYMEKNILNKKIKDIEFKIKKIVKSSNKILQTKNKKVTAIKRHGKYCIITTDSPISLIMHFGMTGNLKFFKNEPEPKKSAMIITFSDNSKLAITNSRKLAKILATENYLQFLKKNTGQDALKYSKNDFINLVKSKKAKIKSILTNQKNIAGIGNIYADEILYHSGISPNKKADKLLDKDIEIIYGKMQNVLKTAIKKGAEPKKMPKEYLIHRRTKNSTCGHDNSKIKKIEINSRSTYYCPQHQK